VAEKKYKTAAALRRACEKYFNSISRTVPATELYNTGEKDEWGHFIFDKRKILNDAGEEIRYIEYAVPPSIAAMCLYLGICTETWRRYISADEEWKAVGTWVRLTIRAYLLHEHMTRTKGIRAVEINLERNYSEGEDVAIGSVDRSAELTADQKLAVIRQLAERVQKLEGDE